MKKFLFIVLFSQILLSSCGQSPVIHQQTPEEFQKSISNNQNAIIVDVRTDNEYKSGHIKNAKLINFYSSTFKQEILKLPKNKEIYLYCHSGNRSGQAAVFLLKNGYKKIYNLQHGIMSWNIKKLPLVKESAIESKGTNSITPEQYKQLINSGKLVFIDFYAPWCAPCKKMMPTIDKLKTEYKKKIDIVKINTDASKQLTSQLKILSIPYLVLYYKGKLLFEKKGATGEQELRAIFDKYIKQYNQ